MLLLLAFSFHLSAQVNLSPKGYCHTDEILSDAIEKDPKLINKLKEQNKAIQQYIQNNYPPLPPAQNAAAGNGSNGANYLIPVVVYIVHSNSSTGAVTVTDQQVDSQIDRLNTEFSGHGVQFCLATAENGIPLNNNPNPGIIRINNPGLSDLDVFSEDAALKGLSSLSSSRYLRIWVVENINNDPAFNGYSSLPGSISPSNEGVVMRYDAFGDIASCGCTGLQTDYDEGKVLVHEVGHYLNLQHIFKNGCIGNGDEVSDTPAATQPTSTACAAFGSINSCPEAPNPPVFDLVNNHMDYRVDNCRTSFTNGQEVRMLCAISLYRSVLVSNSNLVYTGVQCNNGLFAGFIADNYSPCTNDLINFTAGTQTATTTYTWDFGDNSPSVTGSSVSHSYATGGTSYTVTLTVSDAGNTVSESQQIFVTDCSPISSTQGNWYFYQSAGLNFGSGTPTADDAAYLAGTINTGHEACAVQSDASGNLLFYTDNVHVWDVNHNLINPNNSLFGAYTSAGGTIIIPDPANTDQYYILNTSYYGSNGFRYSIVDVSGPTAVMTTTINDPILVSSNGPSFDQGNNGAIRVGEGITAVASCDGYWIIANTYITNGNGSKDYYLVVYELTSTGISYHSSTLNNSPNGLDRSLSVLKASPDGTKLAKAIFDSDHSSLLYDFDAATGIISNETILNTYVHSYGVSFSPDSKILYAHSRIEGLFQYDVTSPNPINTEVFIDPAIGVYALQLGPDDKIYGSRFEESQLAVIHQPNVMGNSGTPNACIFMLNGPGLNTVNSGSAIESKWGLPNMIDADPNNVFTKDISCSVINCTTYEFGVTFCGTNYLWDFGDPNSSPNSSTDANPTHTFSGPGTYTVNVTVDGTLFTKTVVVGFSSTLVGLDNCLQQGVTYNYSVSGAPAGATYTWAVIGGTEMSQNGMDNMDISWTTFPAIVTVQVTDPATGCTETHTITVTDACACDITPNFFVSVSDRDRCLHFFNGQATLGNGCTIQSWDWDFGDPNSGSNTSSLQNPTHSFSGNGTYNVCLTVTADCDGTICTETICISFPVIGCDPCPCGIVPNFSYEVEGCTAVFQDLSYFTNKCSQITHWSWNFGDPSSPTNVVTNQQNPTHTYTANGTYTVCLTIYGNNNSETCVRTVCFDVVITNCGGPCNCIIGAGFSPQVDGCNAAFTNISLSNSCTQITNWSWDFGDPNSQSNTSISQNPTHTYSSNGTYTVCLTAYGNNGFQACYDTYCYDVEITECEDPCECSITPFALYEIGGCTAYFSDASLSSSCTQITNWSWDFGDPSSNMNSSNQQYPTHTYSVNGTYEVCLTVTGNDGTTECQETYCFEVEVTGCEDPCPNCEMSANFLMEIGGCTAYFGDISSTNSCTQITNWSWNFGDFNSTSNTSTDQNPTHTFSGNGTYTVCLTITGNNGVTECQSTMCIEVVITDCDPCTDCELFPNFFTETVGCDVYFSDASTSGNCTQINGWFWNFDDPSSGSNSSTSQNPMHTFSANGTYNVCLTIWGDNGISECYETYCFEIEITDCDPCNNCQLDPNFYFEIDGCDAYFGDASSSGECTEIFDWAWNFGDPNSGSNTSTSQNPMHTFSSNGIYEVCLTIYGSNGVTECQETICFAVEITDCESHCDECDIQPQMEWFTDDDCTFTFEGGNGGTFCPSQQYSWTIISGSTGAVVGILNGVNPTFTFPYAGLFEVCLKIYVEDANGDVICEDEVCSTVYTDCSDDKRASFKVIAIPNPASTEVEFTFEGSKDTEAPSELYIFDSRGSLIYQTQISLESDYQLDVSHLSDGVYYYRVDVAGKQSNTEKLIIKN